MSLSGFIAIVAIIWVASLVPSLLAIFWRARFWRAVILALAALAISYIGLTRFHFDYSTTVNGQVTTHISSKWFFIASVVLGGFALACAFWSRSRVSVVLRQPA